MLVIIERIRQRGRELVRGLPQACDTIVLIVSIIELIAAVDTRRGRIPIVRRLLN